MQQFINAMFNIIHYTLYIIHYKTAVWLCIVFSHYLHIHKHRFICMY